MPWVQPRALGTVCGAVFWEPHATLLPAPPLWRTSEQARLSRPSCVWVCGCVGARVHVCLPVLSPRGLPLAASCFPFCLGCFLVTLACESSLPSCYSNGSRTACDFSYCLQIDFSQGSIGIIIIITKLHESQCRRLVRGGGGGHGARTGPFRRCLAAVCRFCHPSAHTHSRTRPLLWNVLIGSAQRPPSGGFL